MLRSIALLVPVAVYFTALGCVGPQAVDAGRDTAPPFDAGVDSAETVDASIDVHIGIDAPPADSGVDASVDAPVARDAWGTCGLVPQTGCAAGEACRLSERTMPPFVTPPDGPPSCSPAGTHDELDVTDCSVGGRDLCQAGLYCQSWGTCVRYCDPAAAEPCPPLLGDARVCTGEGPAGTFYCEFP